ncbi:MAG TPA: sigma-70 family RNA polymerase sigma factor [Thermoanaerobaculia bacterium]|nr:sigma-70 family RNA polymerase sigma factor [Thermoanaerobaculia bacterium]
MSEDGTWKEEPLNLAVETTPSGPPPALTGDTDPVGLEELFREHHQTVYRAAYRITGSASDAEDVLQAVFLRLLRREDGVEVERRGAAGYLYRAAVNAAYDQLRHRRRWSAVDVEAMQETLEDAGEPGPERHQRGREAGEQLRRCLAALNPRHAEIFALRYFEGLGNKEISRLLGISQTTIAVTLHRVRGRLADELAAHRGA